jgi:hypothetical protein
MTDVHELLRTKENQVARVREEIKALHIVAPLLAEPGEAQNSPPAINSDVGVSSAEKGVSEEDPGEAESADQPADPGDPIPPRRNRLRDWLGFAVGE